LLRDKNIQLIGPEITEEEDKEVFTSDSNLISDVTSEVL
jgi:hypothetical protein